MAATEMTEAQAVNLVRNALLVAGEEMGKNGDHWPVIKSTVYDMMKDWEDVKAERNAFAEMQIHVFAFLEALKAALPNCPAEELAEMTSIVKDLNDAYEACFSSMDDGKVFVDQNEFPLYLKRAKEIIRTLEDEDGKARFHAENQ